MAKGHTLNRDRVVAAAEKYVDQHGIKQLTLPHLAKELGVRSQSLYNYVANREDLLSLVGARMITEMRDAATNHIIGLSGRKALFSLADFIRDYMHKRPMMREIIMRLHEYPDQSPMVKAVKQLINLVERIRVQSGSTNFPSVHTYLGAVLGYIFFDSTELFAGDSAQKSQEDYHQMLNRLFPYPAK